jgi:MFS transporter, DHA1 family, multidrug resistance protein
MMTALSHSVTRAAPPPLWLLVALTCVGPLAVNIFQPFMPTMARDFSTDYAAIQRAVTVYILGIAAGQLIYGPLSDRFGRKPLVVAGGIVFLIANIILAVVPSLDGLLAARVLQAVGGCSGIVLTRAIVRECYPEDKAASAMGYITMSMVIVPAMAPLLGGLMEETLGWRAMFWALALVGIGQIAIGLFWLAETNRTPLSSLSFSSTTNGFTDLLRQPLFMALALCSGASAASYFAFLAGGPYALMSVLGLNALEYGQINLLPALGYFLGNWAAGRYATRWGLEPLIVRGALLFCGGGALLLVCWWLFPGSASSIILPMTLSVAGSGMLIPPVMAAALSVNPSLIGSASALMGLIPTLLGALASEVSSHLLAPDLNAFLLIYAGLSAVSLVAGLIAIQLRHRRLAVANPGAL